MNKLFRFAIAAIAVMALVLGTALAEQDEEELPSFYRPGEEVAYFDFVMKPYPIPIETTTYEFFAFNIPEDMPDFFQIVAAEVINSQPQHLHHFAITGCIQKVDPSTEGLPQNPDSNCLNNIGQWTPGTGPSIFGYPDIDTGVLMGRGIGIHAMELNVHYTDGVYEDAATETFKMATDGIRVYYTPVFRPYSSLTKPLVYVAEGPQELVVPPGEKRFYTTKSCKIASKCVDSGTEVISQMLEYYGADALFPFGETNCAAMSIFCNSDTYLTPILRDLCPSTCGLCDDAVIPESYRITAVNYHAHLLGREMYATLITEETPGTPVAKDLKSQEFWIFDYQETFPLDFDDFATDPTNADTDILRGTEVKIGDNVQVTCVFDSSYQEESTYFGLSTYDEMCITTAYIALKTPAPLLELGKNGGVLSEEKKQAVLNELRAQSFACEDTTGESDVYTGILAEGEDGRDIWMNHPITKTEGCTFPVVDMLEYGPLTSQNCPLRTAICDGIEGAELMPYDPAGSYCAGGTNDGANSNENEDMDNLCAEGGGENISYTCGEIEQWVRSPLTLYDFYAEDIEYVRVYWYQPSCCSTPADKTSSSTSADETAEDDTDSESDSATAEMDSAAGPCFAERGVGIGMVLSAFALVVLQAMIW